MATYKIPSLLPTIKAAKISVPNNAYTNPQPIIDKSYEEFNKGIQKAIHTGVIAMNNNAKYRREEKEAQKRLKIQDLNQRATAYQEVQGLSDMGSSKFDNNKDNYFYSKKDDFIRIKKMMADNPELQQQGLKALAEINNEIDMYKKATPLIIEEINAIRSAMQVPSGQELSISQTTPSAEQQLLLGIGQGGPNVSLVNKDGKLVLYMEPQKWKLENGDWEETNGAQIEIEKYIQMRARGESFVELVPEYKEELTKTVEDIIGVDDQMNPAYIGFKEVPIGDPKDGQVARVKTWSQQIWGENPNDKGGPMIELNIPKTITTERGHVIDNPWYKENTPLTGAIQAKIDMIQYGAFEDLMYPENQGDQDFRLIWDNVIGEDENGNPGQDEPWNPDKNPEQLQIAYKWLANQSIELYDFKEKVMSYKGADGTDDGDKKSTENTNLAIDVYNDVVEIQDEKGAFDYFKNMQIKGKDIVTVEDRGTREGIRLTGGVNDYGEEDSSIPKILELDVHNGKYDADDNRLFTTRKYDLNNPTQYKRLFDDIVEGSEGDNANMRKIRAEIHRLIDLSIEQSKQDKKKSKNNTTKDKKEVNKDYSK